MRLKEQGLVERYKGTIVKNPISGSQTCCLPTMVPKADNMPKLQRRDYEEYKDHPSDQGRPLMTFGNSMEMDKVHTHSIKQSGTLLVIGRETYDPKEKKTINLDHGHRRPCDIFFITSQKSNRKKKITPALSKKS